MLECIYKSAKNTKHSISVIQIDEQTVLIRTKSNVVNYLISLSMWKQIVNDPAFITIRHVLKPYCNQYTHDLLVIIGKVYTLLSQYIIRSQIPILASKISCSINIRVQNYINRSNMCNCNNLHDYTTHNNHDIIIYRTVTESCNQLIIEAVIPKDGNLYHTNMDGMIQTWKYDIRAYSSIGEITISELFYKDKKYIINHRENSLTIETGVQDVNNRKEA